MRVSRIKKKTLPEISDRLKLLEQKYDEIRHNSNYNKEDLGKIKFKIDSLKLKAAISQF